MIEICAGSAEITRAFRQRGWDAWSFDVDKSRPVDVVADVTLLPIRGHFRFLWASPPCTEYALWGMPDSWHPNKKTPDTTILEACIEATKMADGWIIENVAGAKKWFGPFLGPPLTHIGPWYLWSNLPINYRLPFTPVKGTKSGPLSKKSVRRLAPMHPAVVEVIADNVTTWML